MVDIVLHSELGKIPRSIIPRVRKLVGTLNVTVKLTEGMPHTVEGCEQFTPKYIVAFPNDLTIIMKPANAPNIALALSHTAKILRLTDVADTITVYTDSDVLFVPEKITRENVYALRTALRSSKYVLDKLTWFSEGAVSDHARKLIVNFTGQLASNGFYRTILMKSNTSYDELLIKDYVAVKVRRYREQIRSISVNAESLNNTLEDLITYVPDIPYCYYIQLNKVKNIPIPTFEHLIANILSHSTK